MTGVTHLVALIFVKQDKEYCHHYNHSKHYKSVAKAVTNGDKYCVISLWHKRGVYAANNTQQLYTHTENHNTWSNTSDTPCDMLYTNMVVIIIENHVSGACTT